MGSVFVLFCFGFLFFGGGFLLDFFFFFFCVCVCVFLTN